MDTTTLIQRELVQGISSVSIDKKICGSCLLGKQTTKVFPQATSSRASKILQIIHGDICSPIMPRTLAGNKYIFVLINDHSMYMWIILLKEKSEAFEKFKKFKCLIDQETVAKIQISRTDRGGEFVSREFNTLCDNLGIIRYLTAPYTPQQNGVVER